jgi:hypothetical protein
MRLAGFMTFPCLAMSVRFAGSGAGDMQEDGAIASGAQAERNDG